MYGYGYRYSIRPGYVPFNPLTDIDGLQLYLNKNTNVNTKVAADFVAANSEYLSSASTDFDKGNEDFSFGCWVKFDNLVVASKSVLGKWGNSSNNRSYTLFYSASVNKLVFSLSNDGTTNSSSIQHTDTLFINTWYFICGVYDSVNDIQKLSINGGNFQTVANSNGAYASSTEDFIIGTNEGGSFLDGQVDAPFFYDKALTLAEVKALYNSDNGVDYPSLTDLNGTQYAIGQSFDGSTDAFNIDSVLTPLASTTTGEIELYYTPVTGVSIEVIFSYGDTNADSYIYIANVNGILYARVYNSGTITSQSITDSVVFSNGVQEKINIIHNGTDLTIKIDDIEVAQTNSGSNQTEWISAISGLDNGRIGCLNTNSGGNTTFSDSTIQNVKIWSDDTQTTQVAQWLMNDVEGADQTDSVGGYDATPIGTPVSTLASVNNTTITTIESDLVDWWRLNETSGNRSGELGHTLTDNNTVGYALGKVQEVTESGELVWNWIDQSSNAFVFKNDTVTKQPLLSANSIDFDGTDDSLDNSTANVFSGDSSGIIFFSGYFDNTALNIVLSSADTATVTSYIYFLVDTGGAFGVNWQNGGTANAIRSTNVISNGAYYYGYVKSTGTAYEINLNGTIETINVTSGTDNGNWFADVPTTRDNFNLGVLTRTSNAYGKIKANKVIYSNDYTIDTAPILNFLSNPDN